MNRNGFSIIPGTALLDIDVAPIGETSELTASAEGQLVVGMEGMELPKEELAPRGKKPTEQACCNRNNPTHNRVFATTAVDATVNKAKTVIYLYNTMERLAPLLTLLETAKDGDEITLFLGDYWVDGYDAFYGLMNSIMGSRATVTTIGNHLCYIDTVATWLAGDVVKAGLLAKISFTDMVRFNVGNTADRTINEAQFRKEGAALIGWMVTIGFLTEEEAKRLVEDQREFCFFGPDLQQRLARVNAYKASLQQQ